MFYEKVKNILSTIIEKLKSIKLSKITETTKTVPGVVGGKLKDIKLSKIADGSKAILKNFDWRRNRKIALISILVVAFVVVGSSFLFFKGANNSAPEVKEFIKRTGATDVEITILKAEEGSYQTFGGVGGEPRRIEKKYYKVYTRAFNPSNTDNVVFNAIKLTDDLENEYYPDISILFDLRSGPGGFKEFGRDMIVYTRVIREGYIVFPAIAEKAKTLKMIFYIEGGEEAVFEFKK